MLLQHLTRGSHSSQDRSRAGCWARSWMQDVTRPVSGTPCTQWLILTGNWKKAQFLAMYFSHKPSFDLPQSWPMRLGSRPVSNLNDFNDLSYLTGSLPARGFSNSRPCPQSTTVICRPLAMEGPQ